MKVIEGCLEHPIQLDPQELNGRTVLITGGGNGFGRRLAFLCASAGAKVVIGDVNVKGMEETAEMCSALSGSCSHPQTPSDVTKPSSLTLLFDFAHGVFGGHAPDVVVVNAGVDERGQFDKDVILRNKSTQSRYPKEPNFLTLDINYAGALLTCELAENAWGNDPDTSESGERRKVRQMILISSMGGNIGIPGGPMYTIAKHGLMGYWRSMCIKLKGMKEDEVPFSCHVVCPFFSLTNIFGLQVRLGLSGLSTVEPETVAATVLHPIREAGKGPASAGEVFCLPDHKQPLSFTEEEYGPFSDDFYGAVATIVQDRQKKYDDAAYVQQRTADMLSALKLDAVQVSFYAVVGTYAVIQAALLYSRASALQFLFLGVGVAVYQAWQRKVTFVSG